MYTFLTVLHVFVCIFLMLVVLLQAGRGGGIGLAFGGGGGSQSVFGSSGGANFLTKLTAICAVVFFTNSMALAYMSSQSDSRRLQKIAEKKALAKKAEDATNAKLMTDIEKQRAEKDKAAAEKSAAETTPGEGAPAEEKAPAAEGKPAGDKAAPSLKLTMPGKVPGAPGMPVELKLANPDKAEKPAQPSVEKKAEKLAAPKPAVEKKPAAPKPVADKKSDEAPAEKPAE